MGIPAFAAVRALAGVRRPQLALHHLEQRDRLANRLTKTTSLNAILAEMIAEAYADAARLASKETQLPRETFPATCPYSESQILDDGFYPESAGAQPERA